MFSRPKTAKNNLKISRDASSCALNDVSLLTPSLPSSLPPSRTSVPSVPAVRTSFPPFKVRPSPHVSRGDRVWLTRPFHSPFPYRHEEGSIYRPVHYLALP